MKKSILVILTIGVALISVNQLINSKIGKNNIKNEVTSSLNKDEENKIKRLNQEYASRSDVLNQKIKDNLMDNITLIDEKININYQNLDSELYSEETYQIILSPTYLNSLQEQYQNKVISFTSNNHINFNDDMMAKHNPDLWKEWHWYWLAYWITFEL